MTMLKDMLLRYPTSRLILLLFIAVAASSIYTGFIPLLREFNYDVGRMVVKIAKHPLAWIDTARVLGLCVAAFVLWLRHKDEESPTIPQLGLVFSVAIALGLADAFLLLLYLRERRNEQRLPL